LYPNRDTFTRQGNRLEMLSSQANGVNLAERV
jgi:hypothetical protein